MKHFPCLLLYLTLSLAGCQNAARQEEHAHGEGGHSHGAESPPVSYTLYGDHTELFVQFQPLVAGQTTRFAAHLTELSHFTPLTEGQVTVSLIQGDRGIRNRADTASSPGIFRLALQPQAAGTYQLVFEVRTRDATDRFSLAGVTVYPDQQAARAAQPAEADGDQITYLKEQAWKTEFATQEVQEQPFAQTIKTSGQVLSAQGDEVILSASSDGLVSFNRQILLGSPVRAGEQLFTLQGGGLTENNVEVRYREAQANYEKAQLDYRRAQELVKDTIISLKDFQDIRLRYENARLAYNTLARNQSAGGQGVSSPIRGFVKSLMVSEGQFVRVGQPVASISQNRRLILRAEVAQTHFAQLPAIAAAQFRTPYDNQVYHTDSLGGKLVSYGKSSTGTAFIPVSFEIDNQGGLIPGSFVEVFLQTNAVQKALAIPLSALIEEQGTFYAYVQTSGESFQKRALRLGGRDGTRVQVLAGLRAGERVVTKGGYQIKLATAAGALPAHGHEH
jgi:RND family efflux transporter MFP subunit